MTLTFRPLTRDDFPQLTARLEEHDPLHRIDRPA